MKYLGRDSNIKSSLSTIRSEGLPKNISVVDADQICAGPQEIVVAKDLGNKEVVELVVDRGARHVVQMPNLDFARQIAFSAQIMASPDEFFQNPFKFLAENGDRSLLDKPSQVFRYDNKIYAEKDAVLEQMRHDIKTIPRMNTVRDASLMVADEMLMNVLKDAPKYFKSTYPNKPVDGRGSSLTVAHDGSRLLLWTEDDYGSLNVDKLLRRLHQCYSTEQITPLTEEGEGAGLGCKMIFDLSVSMSVFVKPGVKTIFCALLPIGMSYRQQQGLPKNLQIVALTF